MRYFKIIVSEEQAKIISQLAKGYDYNLSNIIDLALSGSCGEMPPPWEEPKTPIVTEYFFDDLK